MLKLSKKHARPPRESMVSLEASGALSFLLPLLIIVAAPAPSRAQGDGSFIPPPINPMKKVSQWPPQRTTAPARSEHKNQGDGHRSQRAVAQTGKNPARAAQIKAKPTEVITIGLSDREIRRWMSILLRRAERAPWLDRFKKKRGRRPVIKVSPVINRTDQHVNTAFARSVARSLLSASPRLELPSKTRAADFLLLGYLVAMDQAAPPTEVKCTLLGLALIDVITGEKVWMDLLRLRKLVTRTKAGPRVRRLTAKETVDLPGGFNDYDALDIARQLRRKFHESAWSKEPEVKTVRLMALRNRTSEAIQTRFISLIMERELIRTPGVRLLAAREEVDRIREERRAQTVAGFAPAQGEELGSTHVMTGWILGEVGRVGGEIIRRYVVSMEAIEVDSSLKVWMATAMVKKITKQ